MNLKAYVPFVFGLSMVALFVGPMILDSVVQCNHDITIAEKTIAKVVVDFNSNHTYSYTEPSKKIIKCDAELIAVNPPLIVSDYVLCKDALSVGYFNDVNRCIHEGKHLGGRRWEVTKFCTFRLSQNRWYINNPPFGRYDAKLMCDVDEPECNNKELMASRLKEQFGKDYPRTYYFHKNNNWLERETTKEEHDLINSQNREIAVGKCGWRYTVLQFVGIR